MKTILPVVLLFTTAFSFAAEKDDTSPKAAISISTAFGQPIPETTVGPVIDDHIVEVNVGQQVVIGSEQSRGTLLWVIDPPTVAVTSFPDGSTQILTTPTEAATITVLQIAATSNPEAFDKPIRFARSRLVIHVGGGKPGPTPNPPPGPPPTPPTSRSIRISLLSDASKAAPDEIIIRNSTQFWNGLKQRGNDWIFYDTLDPVPKAKRLLDATAAAKVTPPALIFDDISTPEPKLLGIVPLPKNFDAIEAEVKKVGGK